MSNVPDRVHLTVDQIRKAEEQWAEVCKDARYSIREQRARQASYFSGIVYGMRSESGTDYIFPPRWFFAALRGDLITGLPEFTGA